MRLRRRDLYHKVLYILHGTKDWLYSLLDALEPPKKTSEK